VLLPFFCCFAFEDGIRVLLDNILVAAARVVMAGSINSCLCAESSADFLYLL
jgi:hypothetical protein